LTGVRGRGSATHDVDEGKHGGSGVQTNGGARTDPVGTAGPLKARDAITFGQRVASMCPAPSDKRA
jgi:hypothetical protein